MPSIPPEPPETSPRPPRSAAGAILFLVGLLVLGLLFLALFGISPVLLACEVLPFPC